MRCGRCRHRYPAHVGAGGAFGFIGPAGPAYSAWRPAEAKVPVRVYLDLPSGVTLQLMVVQGYDQWQHRDDDPRQPLERVRRFHTFGPAHAPVPPEGTIVRVEPPDSDIRVIINRYQDRFGIVRFAPMEALQHTNN